MNYYVNLFDFSLSVNPIKILILFISLSFIVLFSFVVFTFFLLAGHRDTVCAAG